MKEVHYENLYKNEVEHWWYRVRREIVGSIFNKFFQRRDLKILDVGCGTGALMKELRRYGEVYGLDSSDEAIKFCKKRGEKNLTLGSINKIPFEDDFFDVVVSLDVLEHVKDDMGAINEIKRVLKKGGVSIIFVPTFKFLWGVTDVLSKHLRRYRLSELEDKIKSSGLKIDRASYFNTFLFLPILLTRTFVRLFGIKMKNENDINSKFMNEFFYKIFYLESVLFKHTNFPFGVSAMFICKK